MAPTSPRARSLLIRSPALIPLLAAVAAQASDLTFFPSYPQSIDGLPWNVAAADFNGDGRVELVSAGSGNVCVLPTAFTPYSNGLYSIEEPACVVLVPGSYTSVAVADFNGDGKPDFVATNDYDGSVSALINVSEPGGDLAFSPLTVSAGGQYPPTYHAGSLPYSVAVADIDGDGKPDVITANLGDNTVAVLRNTTPTGAAQASFAPPQSFTLGSAPFLVVVADMDGDGKPDVVVAARDTVSVLRNTTANGAGQLAFAAPALVGPVHLAPNGSGFARFAVADLNGDGKPDVVVPSPGVAESIAVYLNATVPGAPLAFRPTTVATPGFSATAIAAGDLDGDGRADLAMPSAVGNTPGPVVILRNTTPPGSVQLTFDRQTYAIGTNLWDVQIAELDGDGRPDILLGDLGLHGQQNYIGLEALINTTGAANVALDQHGITGSWYNPATGGQGIEVEIYPDSASPGKGLLSGGWFTFDETSGARRWFGITGNVDAAQPTTTLHVFALTGGNFAAPPQLSAGYYNTIGEATLELTDCDHARLSYVFFGGNFGFAHEFFDDNRRGVISLTRVVPQSECTAHGSAGTAAPRVLLSGNWFDPATSGQGFIFDFAPGIHTLFAAWYTYAPDGAAHPDANSQDWFTLQSGGFVEGARHVADIPIVATSGGRFDDDEHPATSVQVGTADLTITSCTAMTLTYRFSGGSNAGRTGTIPLQRVGPTPAGCALQ